MSRIDEDVCEIPFPLKEALALFPPRPADQNVLTKGIITAEEAMLKLRQMTDLTADPVDLAMQWQVILLYFPSFPPFLAKFTTHLLFIGYSEKFKQRRRSSESSSCD